MGAVILWSYSDLYGTTGIHKTVFLDEPVSISGRPDWSEQQRDFGVMVTSPAELVRAMSEFLQPQDTSNGTNATPMLVFRGKDTPPFVNSQSFASTFTKNDPTYLLKVLFDHASNDWHDVISHKINVSTVIITGELSNNLPSQRWAYSAIPNSTLIVYIKEEQGDHLLMFRSPVKFTRDLQAFLERWLGSHAPAEHRHNTHE